MRVFKNNDGGRLHLPDFDVERRTPLPDSTDFTVSYGSKAFCKIRQLNRHYSETQIEVSAFPFTWFDFLLFFLLTNVLFGNGNSK